jgi:methyl coenzyme M reductase subunit D
VFDELRDAAGIQRIVAHGAATPELVS